MQISCPLAPFAGQAYLGDLGPYRSAGCEAVQLAYARQKPERVIAELRSADLCLSGVDVGRFEAAGSSEVATAVSLIKMRMKWAKAIGSTNVCLGAGGRTSQSWEILLDGLQRLLTAADAHHLDIHLVNARGSAIEQIEDLRRLFATIRHARLRLAVDVGEFHASAVNPRDVLAEFADLVGCIRVSDRVGTRPMPLAQGEVNLPRIIRKAAECGYRGWFILEACKDSQAGASDALAEAVAYLKRLE